MKSQYQIRDEINAELKVAARVAATTFADVMFRAFKDAEPAFREPSDEERESLIEMIQPLVEEAFDDGRMAMAAMIVQVLYEQQGITPDEMLG